MHDTWGWRLSGRQFAVVVGVNTPGRNARLPDLAFAEDDAKALHAALTDPRTGGFDPADTVLLTGPRATTAAVKQALREAVGRAHPSDLLLFAFAGHGHVPAMPPRDDPFLVTWDLDYDLIVGEPDHGLRMSFLRRDVFDVFAGSSCLILDCCNAGAYGALGHGAAGAAPAPSLRDAVDRLYQSSFKTECALYACPAAGAARESQAGEHGVLTGAVLAGLAGDAAGPDGTVTFQRLVSSVIEKDLVPSPGYTDQGWGRGAVMARPRSPAVAPARSATNAAAFGIEPCANPLEAGLSSLLRLLDGLFRGAARPPFTVGDPAAVLEWLRVAVEAAGAARVSTAGIEPEIVAVAGEIRREDVLALATTLRAKIEVEGHGQSSVVGYVATPASGGPRLLAVADSRRRPADIRMFADVPVNLLDLGEPLPMVLAAAVTAGGELSVDAEVQVITALHRRFGRLPSQLYNRCLEAYRTALSEVLIVFEPVISLSEVPANLGVHCWEALARRTADARSAPLGLLDAAAHWGDEFVVERDRTLATKAIAAYIVAHSQGPWSHDAPKPLSLNVSVRSLLSDDYVDALAAALQKAGLGGGVGQSAVTLEISERDAIEPHPGVDADWATNPNKYFKDKLRAIAKRLQVNFAIDDFGVGHASLDRIASLQVTQVKIDRSILSHPLAIDEIDLVVKLAQETPFTGTVTNQRTVVVEGYDDDSPIPLHQLFAHGIRYVQGYISKEPASTKLLPLSHDLRKHIADLVRSPHARS
jgi:EAL domain-containing protein (putative c-di-GMP-specific phosphodiesterase class I)